MIQFKINDYFNNKTNSLPQIHPAISTTKNEEVTTQTNISFHSFKISDTYPMESTKPMEETEPRSPLMLGDSNFKRSISSRSLGVVPFNLFGKNMKEEEDSILLKKREPSGGKMNQDLFKPNQVSNRISKNKRESYRSRLLRQKLDFFFGRDIQVQNSSLEESKISPDQLLTPKRPSKKKGLTMDAFVKKKKRSYCYWQEMGYPLTIKIMQFLTVAENAILSTCSNYFHRCFHQLWVSRGSFSKMDLSSYSSVDFSQKD